MFNNYNFIRITETIVEIIIVINTYLIIHRHILTHWLE